MSISRKISGGSLGLVARQRRLALGLSLPALIYIGGFLLFPLLYNAWLSLTDANRANLISGEFSFNNFANYLVVLTDPKFWNGLWLSVIFTVACLLFQYVIGFALALLFVKPFLGNGAIRAILLVGWILPPVVTGTVWKWIFDVDYGVLNAVLLQLGFIDQPIGWLLDGGTALFAVIVANLWVGIPFNMLLLLSGLQLIDGVLYEAAEVDGANRFQRFTRVTFPLMIPVSISVLLLGVINTYKVFDLIFVMTKGGPVDSTTTLPLYTYQLTFQFFQFGNGAAASVLTMVLPLVLSVFYVRSLGRED